jgi:hypothetical protein
MIPEYPKFKPLEIEDKPWVVKQLRSTSREICELSLGNIFAWVDFDQTRVTCVNGNLCMLLTPPNEPPYFLEPFGRRGLIETADILLKHAGQISRASKSYADLLPDHLFVKTPLRNQFDYIFSRAELAELKGRDFDGKRNHIKRFTGLHPGYKYLPLTQEMKKDALELFEKWFAIRKESKYFPRLAYTSQKKALLRAFSLYKKLNLLGGALMADDQMKGFTLGSLINPEMASIHFLYGDPASQGSSQTLLWEACNRTYNNLKYVDMEQDLGIPGLRMAKLSYHPVHLSEKFEIKARSS